MIYFLDKLFSRPPDSGVESRKDIDFKIVMARVRSLVEQGIEIRDITVESLRNVNGADGHYSFWKTSNVSEKYLAKAKEWVQQELNNKK